MKKDPQIFILIAFFAIMVVGCRSNQDKISQRWVFTSLQTPSSKALAKAFDESVLNEVHMMLDKKVQGNRLVLEKDGKCFGVLMNCYVTGRWTWSNVGPMVLTQIDFPKKINLKWQVHKQANKQVEFMVRADKLMELYQLDASKEDSIKTADWVVQENGEWTITAESEKTDFDSENADPWSPEMNRWRLKPQSAESKQQLQDRVRNHLQFLISFFKFISQEKERFWVSQDWFSSIVVTGNSGTALRAEGRIPKEWYQCFYDSTQALRGYYMLRTAFHGGIKIPTETNSIIFNKEMLEEILRVYNNIYK